MRWAFTALCEPPLGLPDPEPNQSKDCIHNARPCRVVEITGALETSSHGVILKLAAANSLTDVVLKSTRDSTLPYHDEIEAACYRWLFGLISDLYEQEQLGELRLGPQGGQHARAQCFASCFHEDVARQEWALAGRKSLAISIVMPPIGSSTTFVAHQVSQAAQCLARCLTSSASVA